MSKRRLDKLEGSLSPQEAVIHWLTEAHTYGSLPAYVESLIDQPDTAQPFVALPAQVEKAVWESMRGQRSGFVKQVTREAVGDTVFLLKLVIGLNVHIKETIHFEGLRAAALVWWMRALTTDTADEQHVSTTTTSDARGWPGWRSAAAVHVRELHAIDEARTEAEARYLADHSCLFSDLDAEWHGLLEAATELARVGGALAAAAGDADVSTEPRPDPAGSDSAVRLLLRRARVEALDLMGQSIAADDIADRIIRESRHSQEEPS
jgi:hypothetical protein